MLNLLLGVVIALALSAIVLMVVSSLMPGFKVSGFGSAFIAAAVIVIVSAVISWLLGQLGITIGGGWLGVIVSLIVAAIVLMISDRIVPGMKVSGFGGALVAAIAIAVVTWLANWLVGLLV